MCRASNETGRRCPSHTNPKSVAERNEVRREQYASEKFRDSTAKVLETHGISFVRGDEVGEIYFQGPSSYKPENFRRVVDSNVHDFDDEEVRLLMKSTFGSKPEDGGLWTSLGTLNEEGKVTTEWTDHTHSMGFKVSDAPLSRIKVRKQALIVEIRSAEDLEGLCKAFPTKNEGFSYEAMAKAGIDGLRLTREGNAEAKHAAYDSKMHNFAMWDIDSTVWINNENLSAGKPVEKAKYAYEDDDRYSYDYDDEDGDEDNGWAFLDILAKKAEEPDEPIDFGNVKPYDWDSNK